MTAIYRLGALTLALCLLIEPVLADELVPEPVPPQIEVPAEPMPETLPEPEPVPTPEPTPEVPPEVTTNLEETPIEEPPAEEIVPPANLEYVPGEVIVKFKENSIDLEDASAEVAVEEFAEAQGLEVGESIEAANITILETDIDPYITALELSEDPSVEFAEPNYLYRVEDISTNDTYRALQWALENTGQKIASGTDSEYTGTADADIDGKEALEESLGTDVLVAVIDNGVDYDHPDLADNMWDGTSCKDGTGAFLGGCIHGYNFATSTNGAPENDPAPEHYHGTHVAGTIAASMNNGEGVIGIAPEATIMALRTDLGGASTTVLSSTAIAKAITFADANDVDIINASFGGTASSSAIRAAIAAFDGVFVAAAGNSGLDIDRDGPFYPASYDLPNIISVAASDQNDHQASFSNYGSNGVDLHAPGVNILSTHTSGSGYVYLSGTSMAAPHVSGAAAVLLSGTVGLTTAQIKETILESGDTATDFIGKSATGKRLNVNNALGCVRVGATSTLSVTVAVINDSGRAATTTDFSFTLTGSSTQAFEADGTNDLIVDPCEEQTVSGNNVSDYSLTTDNCADLFILAGASASCLMTYNDNPIVSSGGGGGGGGGGSKKKKKKKVEPKKTTTKKVTPVPTPIPKVLGAATTTPIAAPAYIFTLDRAVGSQGADITALQKLLATKGYLLVAPTGYFGLLTQAALRQYQMANGIVPASGYLGPITRAKLNQP